MINQSLLCDYQLQGGNAFLPTFLVSHPPIEHIDWTMYFTINITFVQQLMTSVPEILHPEEITTELSLVEPHFLANYQDLLTIAED